MKLAGIICEYNPFHNGHKHHIIETKKALGRDSAVVCVMSGDFVQRGDPAVFSKHIRALAAVKGGADLVLELPLPWCMASAEGFARGGVALLDALGCVDYISFGSESGDLDILSALAVALLDPGVQPSVSAEMKSGITYASARQKVISNQLGDISKHLSTPNNILAVEYLKALFELHSPMKAMTVKRLGADHDEDGGSASDLRRRLSEKRTLRGLTPKACSDIFRDEAKNGRGPMSSKTLEPMILSRLRMLREEDYDLLPDSGEGIGRRLCLAAAEEPTLEGVLAAAKTKCCTLARLRRMAFYAALGIKQSHMDLAPPYARVLAANSKGRETLRIMTNRSSIPILTKPAAVRELSDECLEVFMLGSDAHDLWTLGCKSEEDRRGGADFRFSPRML